MNLEDRAKATAKTVEGKIQDALDCDIIIKSTSG
jgi:hypothetical protein